MERRGMVVGHKAGRALVDLWPHEVCQGCGACLALTGRKRAVIEAEDRLDLPDGTAVVVEFPAQGVLTATGLVFLLPVGAALVGYLLGRLVFGTELPAALGALAFFGLAFALAKLLEPRIGHRPTIVRTINREEETCPAGASATSSSV